MLSTHYEIDQQKISNINFNSKVYLILKVLLRKMIYRVDTVCAKNGKTNHSYVTNGKTMVILFLV